jgi:Tol biopolymer transport system component
MPLKKMPPHPGHHDGTRLAFESFRDGNFEIYMVNADGSNPIRLTNDPAGDSNPVWSPVADEIAFKSNRFGNSDIFLLTPNGSVSTLTTNSAPDSAPAWSPNGSTIAFQAFSGELSNICTDWP